MNFELTRKYIENLKTIVEEDGRNEAYKMMKELHAADIAEIFDHLSDEESKYLYLLLDDEKAANTLTNLEEDFRERFLRNLPGEVLAKQFIDHMDSDDAADIVAELSDLKKEEVLANIEDVEQAGDIVDLLRYDEDSAGGLMAKELVAVNENWDINTAIKEIRKQSQDVDDIYYVYVIDDNEVLKGTLSLKKLLLRSKNSTKIANLYNKEVQSVSTDISSEEVAHVMDKYDLVSMPVVDSIGRLVGRITIDDVVDVIREEAEKDYQMISGISTDVEHFDNVWQLTKARLPWLFIGLIGGILGAQVIGNYEEELQMNPAIALFIPLIAAMGGNVGVQSSSIIVQGLANNTIGLEKMYKKLIKELMVASLNGIVLSVLIFLFNLLTKGDLALSITVGVSLFAVIIFASMFGTFIPLLLNKFKIDPALATGPFITTVNDIMGLVIYFAMGYLIYPLF